MKITHETEKRPVLLIACGALAHEVMAILKLNKLESRIEVQCVPAQIHYSPEKIPLRIKELIDKNRDHYEKIFIGFADCGTGGMLDKLLEQENVERIPGAHCYEFFSTGTVFNKIHNDDPTIFYLSDFMVKYFDHFVIDVLGLKRFPELRDMYFTNYTKVLYIAQKKDPKLFEKAKECAAYLELDFDYLYTGYGELEVKINAL